MPLQLGILSYFSAIFPALLVFVLVYAILEKTKILGENKIVHSIAAIVAAFLVLLSRDIIAIISFGAPWFVLVFVFLTLLLLIYRFMGASEEDLAKVIRTDKPIQWAVFAVGAIIVIAAISNIYGQRLLEKEGVEGGNVTAEEKAAEEGRTFSSELYDTVFNPKVLGLIFIFLVAVFAIALLTRETS
jgi:magnesium-transporting ATPase (P-type)